MSKYDISGAAMAPIPAKRSTMLLLINNQLGFRDIDAWGTGASNPDFEQNTMKLLEAFRKAVDAKPDDEQPYIHHAQYRPVWTDHPLHVSKVGPFGPNGEEKRAIDFLEFSAPRKIGPDGPFFVYSFDEPSSADEYKKFQEFMSIKGESIMTSHGHSIFINTMFDEFLNKKGIRTLLVAGMSTDHTVSTAVRMAQNLALVGKWGGKGNLIDTATSSLWTDGEGVYGAVADSAEPGSEDAHEGLAVQMPRIIVVGDATRTFGRGGIDAQTVHDVHIEALKDFAEVRTTEEVVKALS